MMRAVLSSTEPLVIRRLTTALSRLRIPYDVAHSNPYRDARNTIACIDSRLAAALPHLAGPTIVILSGATVSDELVQLVIRHRAAPLRAADITPTSLLNAIIVATARTSSPDATQRLFELGSFGQINSAVVNAFLQQPTAMKRLTDLRRALAPLSREAAQRLVRESGYRRAEHLFTAMRGAVWSRLMQEGISRTQVEEYLGIYDRCAFRRACRRAGVPTAAVRLVSSHVRMVSTEPTGAGT